MRGNINLAVWFIPPAMPSIVLLSWLVFQNCVTPVSTHDFTVEGGCILADFPDLMQQHLKVQAEDGGPQVYAAVVPDEHSVQGVHLALEGPQGLRVTWINPEPLSNGTKFNPVCVYWSQSLNKTFQSKGYFYTYNAGLFTHTLNSAILDLSVIPCGMFNHTSKSVTPGPCVKVLTYMCGDSMFGFSNKTHVLIQDEAAPFTPASQFAIVGDMGIVRGSKTIQSIAARIPATADRGLTAKQPAGVQILLHAGDISYADFYAPKTHNNSYVWVDYMNALQSVAGRVPYMTAPGNHETEFNFAAYLNWLPMPHKASVSSSPFWYSFDYLGVHVISFSTEHDFSPGSVQHQWMQQDLKRANQNRDLVPWLIVIGHRPLYCSSLLCWERCHNESVIYRSYLEDMFFQYHVDAVITGHNHQYERSYPVYHGKATQKNYTNPMAPVYIVNGAAGNPELNDPTFEPFIDWRGAYQASMRTGYLLMTPSQSQLKFDYIMTDQDVVFDSFTIVRQ